MTSQGSKLGLDPAMVRAARHLARIAGQPIVDMARSHSTVSVERAVLRLAGLEGADDGGMPWVNRLVDAVRETTGLEHGVALPAWDALLTGGYPGLAALASEDPATAAAAGNAFRKLTGVALDALGRTAASTDDDEFEGLTLFGCWGRVDNEFRWLAFDTFLWGGKLAER